MTLADHLAYLVARYVLPHRLKLWAVACVVGEVTVGPHAQSHASTLTANDAIKRYRKQHDLPPLSN